MIWIANENTSAPEASLVSHVRSVISEHCSGSVELDPMRLEELAKAVAAYVSEAGETGLYVESDYLVMLASRALFSLGEREAAHRLLVFGTGLVRPSSWEIRGGASIWTLDFGRMAAQPDASLELVFFKSLNVVLDCVAEVWDASAGEGTLALRRVSSAAADVIGQDRDPRAVKAFAREVRGACEAKLKQLGRQRQWRCVPELMRVD